MNISLLHQQSLPIALGARKRRRASIFPSKSPFLKLASSLAAISLRDLSPPPPLDLLLDHCCRRLISFSGERRRRRPWNRGGLVGLLVSLAAALGVSLLRESSEKGLRIRVLAAGMLGLKNGAWRRGDLGAFLLGFACCLLIWNWKGMFRKRARCWRLRFW